MKSISSRHAQGRMLQPAALITSRNSNKLHVLLSSYQLRPLAVAVLLACTGLTTVAQASAPNSINFPVKHPDYKFEENGLIYEGLNGNDKYAHIVADGKHSNYKIIWKDFKLTAGSELNFESLPTELKEISFLNIVKGGPRSVISGTIRKGAATEGGYGDGPNINFYLINPNGITMNKGWIQGFNEVYLGTEKVSDKLLKHFDSSDKAVSFKALTQDAAAGKDPYDLNLGEGMGKVRLFGYLDSNNLIVNGSQIIIGNLPDLLRDNDSAATVRIPESMSLHSSTNRIDIGGDLDKRIADSGKTYRQYLEEQGLVAAKGDDASIKGSHAKGEFVDHSDEEAITSAADLADIDWSANAEKKYWVADNISLDEDLYAIMHESMDGTAFSGSLDGAFNTITYEGKVEKDGSYGLFSKLDGAHIANLKIYEASLEISSDQSDNLSHLKVGALAGEMVNTTLDNVEVDDFNLKVPTFFNKDNVEVAGVVGGLVGEASGKNVLTNVTANLDSSTVKGLVAADMLGTIDTVSGAQGAADGTTLYYGHMVGQGSGELEQHGIVAALGNDASAYGVSDEEKAWEVAASFAEAKEQAEKRGEGDLVDELYAGSDDELKLKGFLQPFFIHDYNYTYGGKDDTHNYGQLEDWVNEGYDINDYFEVEAGYDQSESNAGDYEYSLSDQESDEDFGEKFYFTYSEAGQTWDDNGGGTQTGAQRTDRPDGLSGVATMIINKKQIVVDIGDQTIAEGDSVNLTPGSDTIANYDDIAGEVTGIGDSMDDLGLQLDEEEGKIVGSTEGGSGNYEVTFDEGTVTVEEKPPVDPDEPEEPEQPPVDPDEPEEPEQPPVDPDEPEEPEQPPVDPDEPEEPEQPPVDPDEPEIPEVPDEPELPDMPDPEPQEPIISADIGHETKCENCGDISEQGLKPSWTRLHNQAQLFLGALDYTKSLIAALLFSPAVQNAAQEPEKTVVAQSDESEDKDEAATKTAAREQQATVTGVELAQKQAQPDSAA